MCEATDPRVCMLIQNEVFRDGRVMRAASTLAERYDLTVLGVDTGKVDFDPDKQRRLLGFKVDWIPLRFTAKLPRNTAGYLARYAELNLRVIARGIALRPDVIHAHEPGALPAATAIQAATRAKLVYDCHELYRDSEWFRTQVWGKPSIVMETWAMKRADAVIACNHHRAEIMVAEYGCPKLPFVVRNVPPRREYRPSNSLQEYVAERNPAIKRICLHQGAIIAGRGIEVTVNALAHLPEDVGLVLVGGGLPDYLKSIERLAEQAGVASRAFLHGPVDHAELFRLTCSADLGIVIYQPVDRNNYYCAPNKLYEYAAAALPMLGADLPPIREFFEQYQTGEAFDPEDPESLAQAAIKLLDDPDIYDRYRRNCLSAAKVECWETESASLMRVYQSILGS